MNFIRLHRGVRGDCCTAPQRLLNASLYVRTSSTCAQNYSPGFSAFRREIAPNATKQLLRNRMHDPYLR